MSGNVFLYTAGSLGVSSFTGTATEFDNIRAGLAKVWETVNKGIASSGKELVNLMYCSATGSLTARLSSGSAHTVYGARFHGEISTNDACLQLLESVCQLDF